jgi:hypothetical protein
VPATIRRRRPSPVRRSVLALVALATLSACGSSKYDSGAGPAPSGADITLSVVVTTDAGADPATYDLRCGPSGGNHPQPEQSCAALQKAGRDVLEPVAGDRACTQIYGGPQTAAVRGSWEGVRVDASFDRTNGCEIDRWEQLGTTFFAVPLQ